MKKFLSLIIAFILAVSAFSICAYADGPKTPTTLTCAEIHYTDSGGNSSTLYFKDGKVHMKGLTISENSKIKINVLIDGDYIYIYFNAFPLFHIKLPYSEYGPKPEDLVPYEPDFVKSYNETRGNTTYYVDEFIYEDEIIKHYYLNDEFVFSESALDDYTQTFTLVSTSVDDKKLEIPFYSIDISFIFNWIFGNRIIY